MKHFYTFLLSFIISLPLFSQIDLTIRDYVYFTQDCQLPEGKLILSSDPVNFDFLFEPEGGNTGPTTNLRHQYYREVTVSFVNSSGVELNHHTFPSRSLEFDTGISIDESMLQGLPDDSYRTKVAIRYFRNQNINNPFDPLQRFYVNGGYINEFHLPTNQDEHTEYLYNVLCFKYENCHRVKIYPKLGFARTKINGGSGNFDYQWAIDNFYIADYDDRTELVCGSHTYSVTVTDLDTGCEVIASRTILRDDCDDPFVPCTTETISPTVTNPKPGVYSIAWNTIEGVTNYKVRVIPNDPECCGGEGPIEPYTYTTTKSPLLVQIAGTRCFSYEIIPICKNGAMGQSSGKKCRSAERNTRSSEDSMFGDIDVKLIDSELMPQIKIYPNPVSDFLNIDFDKELKNPSVYVFDMNGRFIDLVQFKDTRHGQLDISEYQLGTYIIQIRDQNQILKTDRIAVIK